MATADIHLSPVHASTSSRLGRAEPRPAELAALEEELAARAISFCHEIFDASPFFRALAAGELEPAMMRYAFAEYGHFRIQLHRWFALVMMKAPNAADPGQRAAIMALADHTFVDLRDNHDLLYQDMLEQLGAGPGRLHSNQASAATQTYVGSFFEDFASPERGFFPALAALSGRELCVSLRNGRLLESYFASRALLLPTWLTLHAELELDHFRDAVRPVIAEYSGRSLQLREVEAAIERAITRHVQYFDALLDEFRTIEV